MGKKLVDPLAAVKANPTRVTVLMLNPSASRNMGHGVYEPLAKFPTEIFACKNLVELVLFRGITTGTIPKEIGSFKKLKKLTIGGLSTKELPAEIGSLDKLEEFNIAYLHNLTKLPSSIGKLTKLRALQAPYAGVTELPSSIGNLKALRVINFTNSELASVPAELWKLTNLEELYLPESVRVFPPGIAALTKLRVLHASPQAIACVAREFPKLKLEALHVVGDHSGTSATSLPDEIGQIKTLVHLGANFIGLTSLPPLPQQLVELEVTGNKLATLVDVIAQLPTLASLEYSNNPIAISERRELEKLMKLSPAKRAAQLARRATAEAPKPAKTKAKPKIKLARIGQVASVNASLSLIWA